MHGGNAARGDRITVDGEIIDSDELFRETCSILRLAAITKTGTGDLRPLGVGNKALSVWLNRIPMYGMLVKVWGKVTQQTYVPSCQFELNDGSGVTILCLYTEPRYVHRITRVQSV